MDLAVIWFLLIAVLWTGYLVLEGFDFPVSACCCPSWAAAPTPGHRSAAACSSTPSARSGTANECGSLTAGGATFAAFPLVCHLFSGFISRCC